MSLVLDTNIFIAIQRNEPVAIANLARQNRAEVGVSSIVYFELYFGAFGSDAPEGYRFEIDRLRFRVIDFDRDDALAAGRVRDQLRRAGTPVGPYDVLIAGQALARGLTLVTRNTSEFSRVPGLVVEDWLD